MQNQGLLSQITAILSIATVVCLVLFYALLSRLSRVFTSKEKGDDLESRMRRQEYLTRHLDTKTKP